ncbi:MAG: VWA domain-containing protein [Sulfurospirillaceae bacterium]|nr:VWA domain-containing protein [Sulfurospirillaceae bacterium]
MSFESSKLNVLTEEQYNTMLFNVIGAAESFFASPINIGDGVMTIGYGYNMNVHSNNLQTFLRAGITLTQEQQNVLQTIDGMVSSGRSNADITNYISGNLNLTITTQDGKNLFSTIVRDEYELSTIRDNLTFSRERVALVNIAYNTPARLRDDRAPLLVAAIQNGDRVATWFYLRYPEDTLATVSNQFKVGILNRHHEASNLFGYLDADFDESSLYGQNYLKYMTRFLTQNSQHAIDYVNSILSSVDNPNSFAYEQDTSLELDYAKQRLASLFGEGVTIDGDVVIGSGIEDFEFGNTNFNDTLQGTSKSDLIFGERGDDILIGNGGGDYMEGGEGFDTYYTNDKDTIYDSDGKGEVYLNDTLLVGGLFDESSGFYVSEDKSIEYQLANNTLKVKSLVDSSELTIEGYIQKEQSLGINLAKSLGKEVAIVIDTTGSMRSSIDTAKQQAAIIAGNIFKSNSLDSSGVFSKVSIVTFSDDNIKTIGTYYNQTSFQAGINKVNIEGGSYEYHCRALMEGMSNFTKDNGLDKQMFLITDEPGDDNERMGEVIAIGNSSFGISFWVVDVLELSKHWKQFELEVIGAEYAAITFEIILNIK